MGSRQCERNGGKPFQSGGDVGLNSSPYVDVTPDVIFGSGNDNGAFTVATDKGVELGLRGKLRYDLSGRPQNTFNWDGVDTYTFDLLLSNAPANRSIWNFEWSINSDVGGTLGRSLCDLTYLLSIDSSVGTIGSIAFDPIALAFADHAIGNNATVNGSGAEATTAEEYAAMISANNVAQNSWNLGFFMSTPPGDPQLPGVYTISLKAFSG